MHVICTQKKKRNEVLHKRNSQPREAAGKISWREINSTTSRKKDGEKESRS